MECSVQTLEWPVSVLSSLLVSYTSYVVYKTDTECLVEPEAIACESHKKIMPKHQGVVQCCVPPLRSPPLLVSARSAAQCSEKPASSTSSTQHAMSLTVVVRAAPSGGILRDAALQCRFRAFLPPCSAAYSSESAAAKTKTQVKPSTPASPSSQPLLLPPDKPSAAPRVVSVHRLNHKLPWALGPVASAVEAYGQSQRRRPYTTQIVGALVVFFCADLSAQHIGGREYDARRTARALVIGLVAAVPFYKW